MMDMSGLAARLKTLFRQVFNRPPVASTTPLPTPHDPDHTDQDRQDLGWLPENRPQPAPFWRMPPACPPLPDTPPALLERYRAFVAGHPRRPEPGETRIAQGGQLATDLHRQAVDLGSSKAHEQSPDIYWLTQCAAVVALLAEGTGSARFLALRQAVEQYRDAPLTTRQVGLFRHYVSLQNLPAGPSPRPADMDELLAWLPRLYPGGIAVQPCFYTAGSPWPRYVAVVEQFYSVAARECWSDQGYDMVHSGEMLRDPARVATASLAELKSMLTWCVRGERFCDGHHAHVIEEGYILTLLQRLAVLRQAIPDNPAPECVNRNEA